MSTPTTFKPARMPVLPSFSRLPETELFELEMQKGPVLVDPSGAIVAPLTTGRCPPPMCFEDRLFYILVECLKGQKREIEKLEREIRTMHRFFMEHPEEITDEHRAWLEEASFRMKGLVNTYEQTFKMMTEIHKSQVRCWEMANEMS